MSATRVMVVDDEASARRVLRTALISRGFEIVDVRSGEEALASVGSASPDVVLLDLKMPGMGGLATCRALRTHSQVPIIVVSVRQTEKDKIEALETGADDYVTKPFEIDELVARIRAVKRRSSWTAPRFLTLDQVEIDLRSREVKREGITTHLTAKEFKLLDVLISHSGEIVSYRRLLQAVWGPDYGDEIEYLRVCINQLRKKIEPHPGEPRYILTDPHAGYRFVRPSSSMGQFMVNPEPGTD
ncbi:MAG: two component transcriptional regulator, winged helix family [Bryobacterales bacterium]|nr:two component transcriptional regulator, winged helix family [Bryobacterales bacterium]